MEVKNYVFGIIGAVGSIIAGAFGGWTAGLTSLLIAMVIDYISGLVVAGVFHTSKKTESGALESNAGWKGICKKIMTLLIVVLAYRMDLMIGSNYIRDAVVIAFFANEVLSIAENVGLMGITFPKPIQNAIDVLVKKYDTPDDVN